MCGVLGITIQDYSDKYYELIRNLFIQSMIRGKHATGVSYVKNKKIHTIKESIPADEFINKQDLESWRNEDGNLYCIGHVRYSTSDLRYNQPFSNDKLAIAHNGVISQEPSSTWFDTFGYRTETENDSELILHMTEDNQNPLHYHNTSMAVCSIYADKRICAYRNHERPLYYYNDDARTIFASTKDILFRSGIDCNVRKTRMFEIYNVNNFMLGSFSSAEHNWLKSEFNIEDLQ
jgi:glutamine phosphoribosylpyrophosphate amidotransferase